MKARLLNNERRWQQVHSSIIMKCVIYSFWNSKSSLLQCLFPALDGQYKPYCVFLSN